MTWRLRYRTSTTAGWFIDLFRPRQFRAQSCRGATRPPARPTPVQLEDLRPPAPPPAPPRPPEPAPIGEQPGDVLSPTGANQYLNCGFRWYARHVLKLPDPKNGNLLLGSAVDRALTENFRQKIETKRDLPEAGVRAIYAQAWDEMRKETEFHPDEDPDTLKAEGDTLARMFLEKWAPKIDPAAVQMKVRGFIAGISVRGFIDILDTDGRVIDLKTAKKTPSEVSSDYRFQVATYSRLVPDANGKGLVLTAVRNKTPKLVDQEFAIEESDMASLERIYPLVRESIRKGVFLPNRSHFMCGRKYCSFWRACEKEFGGKVGE